MPCLLQARSAEWNAGQHSTMEPWLGENDLMRMKFGCQAVNGYEHLKC